jgi:hypothetical protein
MSHTVTTIHKWCWHVLFIILFVQFCDCWSEGNGWKSRHCYVYLSWSRKCNWIPYTDWLWHHRLCIHRWRLCLLSPSSLTPPQVTQKSYRYWWKPCHLEDNNPHKTYMPDNLESSGRYSPFGDQIRTLPNCSRYSLVMMICCLPTFYTKESNIWLQLLP